MNKTFKRIASLLLFGLMFLSTVPTMAAGFDDGNLITNGGFENGLTGWNNLTQDNLYSADSVNIYEGSYSAYFPQDSTFSKYSGSVTAEAGVPYIASYMAKAASGSPSVMLALGGLSGSDGVAPYFSTELETPSPTLSTDRWTNACYTFCSSTQKTGVVYLLSWVGIANPIYFDNFYVGELKIADLEYTGSTNQITVPAAGIESTLSLSAEPSNQLGTKIGLYTEEEAGAGKETFTISWEPAEDYAGVSVDGSTLKVTSEATATEIQVVATATLMYPGVPEAKRTSYQETFTFELTGSAKPEAKGISVLGSPYLGQTLTGFYNYFSAVGDDEDGSEYQWEISATGAEPFSPIAGATNLNLAVEDYMDGQYVRFTVIPSSAVESGDLTKSTPVRIYANAKAATNLLKNGGFEDGLNYWPATSEVTSSADAANVFEGSYSAYAGRGATWADFDQPFNVKAGKTYIASYMAKSANNGSTPNAMIILENLDGADVAPYFKSSLEPQTVALNSTNWSNIFYTFTPKSSFETSPFIVAWAAIDPIYIDDFFVGELLIDDIKYTGADTMVTVPAEGSTTVALAAEPYNQLGTKGGLYTAIETGGSATYTMSWELADAYEGVSLDGSTLTISSTATTAEVEVTAICVPNYTGASQENFTKTFTITLDRAERPEAKFVSVTGSSYVGQTLKGHYTYFDVNNNDQQGTTFFWEICDTEEGDYDPITDEEGEELVLTSGMKNKYVRFCVTPKSTVGVGKTVASDPVFVYADLKSASNLITNGGFESGLSGWNVSSNVTSYSADSANIYEGSYSAYLANGAKYTDFLKRFNVTQGKTYIASYMAKAASGTPSVILTLKNLANASEGAPYYGTALEPNSVALSTDVWKNIVCTFTPKSSFESELYIPSWVAIDPIYVDDIFVGELFIDGIEFTGSSSAITIPLSGKTSTLTLSAAPYNQLGTKAGLYTAEQTGGAATYEMTWALKDSYSGVSLDGATLTVSSNVAVDEIQVEAICTPKYAGASQESFKQTFTINVFDQQIPVASDVSISGITAVNRYLTGNYTYFDINDDVEEGSIYEWKICDTENGTYSAISGANTKQLKVTSAMRNKYIRFYVIPKNANGAGVQKKSEPVFFYVDPTKDGNADLKEILIDGTPLDTFKAERTTYDVELPYEEEMTLPVVSATAKKDVATVTITQAADFSSSAEITVTSENSAYVKTYTINFNYVGREVITSENLLANGGFEDGLTGWNANTGTISVNEDAANVYEGEKSALQSQSAYTDFNHNITLTGGKTYLFSFKAKAASGSHKLVGSVDGFNEDGQAPFRDVLEPQWLSITADKWYTYNMSYYPKTTKGGKIYITNWTSLPDTYIDDVYLGELLISDLQYKGKTTIQIPKGGEADQTIYLTATPFNQLGTTAGLYSAEEAGEAKACYKIEWELAWDCPGVSIEGNKLTVSSDASQESLEIKAICKPLYPGALQTEYVKRFTVDLVPHDDVTPRATNVKADGILTENEVLMAEYTYYQVNSVPEGESVYKWYYADSENGPYTEITGENGLTYTVRREHLQGFIKFAVQPVSENQVAGREVMSNFICAPKAPVVSAVTVTGTQAFDQTLIGSYQYSDMNGDKEAGSLLQWKICDTAEGRYSNIAGATTNRLRITSSMKNKYVIFCVTPKNSLEGGGMVSSQPVLAAAAPTVENLEIVKVSSRGSLYRVEYDYVHPCGAVPEGATICEWYIGNSLIATGSQFDASGHEGERLTVKVTPVASLEPATGAIVTQTIEIPDDSSSAGSVGGLGGRAPGGSFGGGSSVSNQPQQTPTVARHWAQDAIDFVVSKNIMAYPAENDFKVDELVTRADFIYYVAKAAGLPEAEYRNEFKDVSVGNYYAAMLQSAVDAGIISKDENFYPNRNVSREEICKIITLAAKVKSDGIGAEKIDAYADRGSMAEWAVPYIKSAVLSGLLIGVSETEFLPKGMVTRAQTAVIVKRMMDSLV